ncbi:uncharacterized protein LOC141710764 [Apium graveolens]|uniref:uncharacterized protein LOC141710764 n=1 Tax=Apium graveolens TaxID=4045 RepID=UPI003D799084
MALTRVLRLSNSTPLHHCRRTFSTALNHTRVVFPTTVNRDSKTCSKPLIGSFIRHFSASPVVSDDMQKSDSEDLIWTVKSLRQDVESLRKEFSLLSEVVSTMQKTIAQRPAGGGGGYVSDYVGSDDDNYVCDSILNDNEKKIEKSNFSEAMATHFNTDTMCHSLEETRDSGSEEKATGTISDFSKAMATHFNTKIVISQDSKAAENTSQLSEEVQKSETGDVSEEISESDIGDKNEKIAADKINDFSEEIQKSEEKATERISNISHDMASHDAEIEKTEPEGNKEMVTDGKEHNALLEEIESEISLAEDLSCLSSQSVNFPEDFPFKLEDDFPGEATVTLKGSYKLEKVFITVKTPSVFTPITVHNYQYHKSSNFIMPLTVEICSDIHGERDIAFDCSAFSNGILIENVYGSYETDKLVFSELNDNLKEQFKKYLEMRGIKPSTTNTILGYMLDKVNREKLRSLYKLREQLEEA